MKFHPIDILHRFDELLREKGLEFKNGICYAPTSSKKRTSRTVKHTRHVDQDLMNYSRGSDTVVFRRRLTANTKYGNTKPTKRLPVESDQKVQAVLLTEVAHALGQTVPPFQGIAS